MASVTRIALDGGGYVLFEAPPGVEGPVKAGRFGDAVQELPGTLQSALEPVTDAAQGALEQLRKARPDEIRLQFGVDLSVAAGAMITKGEAGCHLRVTVIWFNGDA
ncbi:CU044_2847 family protein [Streptomyces sp. NPDC127190]|uniref:CU044_2847 family protein n=1 Tax=unclassified Streptomyces TaxID=2593676 RepID=UPI00363D637F